MYISEGGWTTSGSVSLSRCHAENGPGGSEVSVLREILALGMFFLPAWCHGRWCGMGAGQLHSNRRHREA